MTDNITKAQRNARQNVKDAGVLAVIKSPAAPNMTDPFGAEHSTTGETLLVSRKEDLP